MKIYHVEFAKTGNGMSGGETCMVETAKAFEGMGYQNVILTTDHGKKVYEKIGLKESELVTYKTIAAEEQERKYHIFISYILRTFNAVKLVKNLTFDKDDAVICHSAFFPNSIPTYFIYRKNKKIRMFYWHHLLVLKLFRGFEGAFDGKFHWPSIRFFHLILNLRLYALLTPKNGIILTPTPYYANMLKSIHPKNIIYVIKYYGGAEIHESLQNTDKEFDLVWMGRFQKLKGLNHFMEIVRCLKKIKPDIKIIIMGGGTKDQEDDLCKLINDYQLNENIDFRGFVTGNERFTLLSKGKIFVMSSIFESYGLVNIEAMSCGIPVIAFDLPVYDVFEKGMIRIQQYDYVKFANSINQLLTDKKLYTIYSSDALEHASKHSWEKTAREIVNLF